MEVVIVYTPYAQLRELAQRLSGVCVFTHCTLEIGAQVGDRPFEAFVPVKGNDMLPTAHFCSALQYPSKQQSEHTQLNRGNALLKSMKSKVSLLSPLAVARAGSYYLLHSPRQHFWFAVGRAFKPFNYRREDCEDFTRNSSLQKS